MKKEKKLIYVPILHTTSDMGTFAGSIRETYVKKFGEKKWGEHVRVIDEMWLGIRKRLRTLKLPFRKVKVYQDGLPICGKEKKIIHDLAKRGSPNHELVLWLIQQGAMVVGTEDHRLLVREYTHLKKIMESKTHQERERLVHEFEKEADELLKKRDQRIRDQIVLTLRSGETGVIFLGLLHRVDEILPPEIKISYLIHRLPFRRSFEMEMVA